MNKYQNLSKRSGVDSYLSSRGALQVKFNDGSKYTYTRSSAGAYRLGKMRKAAVRGIGLNKYINKSVGTRYASKV